MNFNSKLILTLALLTFTTFGYAGECKKESSSLKNKWEDIEADRDTDLLEASYKGIGDESKQKYVMHLKRYQSRDDVFLAVSENFSTGVSALGFLRKVRRGVYDWYYFAIDFTEFQSNDDEYFSVADFYPKFKMKPIFRFRVKKKDGKIRVYGKSLIASHEQLYESLTFKEMIAPRLRSDLQPGTFSEKLEGRKKFKFTVHKSYKKDSCGISKAFDMDHTYWMEHYKTKAIGTVEEGNRARMALAGVFAFHKLSMDEYVENESDSFSRVGISVKGWNGFASSSSSRLGGVKDRLLIFEVPKAVEGRSNVGSGKTLWKD